MNDGEESSVEALFFSYEPVYRIYRNVTPLKIKT